MSTAMRVAVIIPAFRVREQILSVLALVGDEVQGIFVVDDCCPEQSGEFVRKNCSDPRLRVLKNSENLGVGGATLAGFTAAANEGFQILVKVDGDGQIDPRLIPRIIKPLTELRADYVKGNRFYSPSSLTSMPGVRLFGNSMLSFVNKVVTGYWNLMDPTNGFVAINAAMLQLLPLERIEKRYFFESDMLFRLNTFRAVVAEIPMSAVYGDEKSNLRISRVVAEFPPKYITRFFKRIFYSYFLRDFNACSVFILSSLLFLGFGAIFGLRVWIQSHQSGVFASDGTVMLAALPIILGFQSFLAAVGFDVGNVPTAPLSRDLTRDSRDS